MVNDSVWRIIKLIVKLIATFFNKNKPNCYNLIVNDDLQAFQIILQSNAITTGLKISVVKQKLKLKLNLNQ